MTNENLVGINQLYSKYADSGLVIHLPSLAPNFSIKLLVLLMNLLPP